MSPAQVPTSPHGWLQLGKVLNVVATSPSRLGTGVAARLRQQHAVRNGLGFPLMVLGCVRAAVWLSRSGGDVK